MPDCFKCLYLNVELSECSISHPPKRALRSCLKAINTKYVEMIQKNDKVLELGCGSWSPIYEYCKSSGIEWHGIDILKEYMGKPTIASKIGSVENIPYNEATFDFVIGNQTMEHWEENNVHLQKGLSEVFRVLKPGGKMLMNVPIHYHGGPEFIKGDLRKHKNYLNNFCDKIEFETWRKYPAPLPENLYLQSLFWFSSLRKSNAYILDIVAEKMGNKVPYFNKKMSKTRWRFNNIIQHGPLYYPTIVTRNILNGN